MDQENTPATPEDMARIFASAQSFARYCSWLAGELRRPAPHPEVVAAAAEALDVVAAS